MRSCAGRSATPRNSASARVTQCRATLFTIVMRARNTRRYGLGKPWPCQGWCPRSARLGTAFDNALAETTIGLYKNEAVRDDSPFRRGPLHRLADVELLTADWVGWYNTDRLMHRLGRIPPIEYEAIHYAATTAHSAAAHQ